MMKKTVSLLLAAALCLMVLSACGEKPSRDTELIVFAAASLTETLTELKTAYEKDHPGLTVTCNFDSSGTLLTQIQEGAACDLFLSAAPKQMNALEEAGGLLEDSRVDLLENQVVLCVPEGNPKGIDSFDALAQALEQEDVLLAMGNSDVPVGQYIQKILDYYGLDEEELAAAGRVTYGSNVKEVTTQVSEGSVDCGVIYATDAFSAGLTAVDSAAAELCGQVIYPAAVVKGGKNSGAAQDFLNYLASEEAMEVFRGVGFVPAK